MPRSSPRRCLRRSATSWCRGARRCSARILAATALWQYTHLRHAAPARRPDADRAGAGNGLRRPGASAGRCRRTARWWRGPRATRRAGCTCGGSTSSRRRALPGTEDAGGAVFLSRRAMGRLLRRGEAEESRACGRAADCADRRGAAVRRRLAVRRTHCLWRVGARRAHARERSRRRRRAADAAICRGRRNPSRAGLRWRRAGARCSSPSRRRRSTARRDGSP